MGRSLNVNARDLKEGDVVLRPEHGPLLFVRHVPKRGVPGLTCVFRCLETTAVRVMLEANVDIHFRHCGWDVLERSHVASPSGSVGSYKAVTPRKTPLNRSTIVKKRSLTSKKNSKRAPRGVGMSDPRAVETLPAPAADAAPAKAKKTRTVDYTRTDKRPHSFRYKRGSTFTTRGASVALSKEADGALVIGPASEGAQAADNMESGTLELVSVKKRPNGKTAIAFKRVEDGAEIFAYDARAARAALRAS